MPNTEALQSQAAVDESVALAPVRKSVSVRADPARAFQVFTSGMDQWWPRSHHIGDSPMAKVVVEGRPDGAIYTEQENGTICPWGRVLAWEPPHRFVMAWQVSPEWKYEPDLARCSEVEILFTPKDDGSTLVELEHRHFERHGGGFRRMCSQVSEPGGWGGLLELYRQRAESAE